MADPTIRRQRVYRAYVEGLFSTFAVLTHWLPGKLLPMAGYKPAPAHFQLQRRWGGAAEQFPKESLPLRAAHVPTLIHEDYEDYEEDYP